MQAAQNREGDDLATCMLYWHGSGFLLRNLLSDPLMRSCLVKVVDIGSQHPLELLLLQDEQVIETLATYTAQKAFTDGIGPWGVVGRFEDLDAAGCGHTRETGSKFAITITDEILRRLSKGSRFPQLLRGPDVGWRASDPHMDDSARVQIDDEEGKQGAKEEVGDLQEITGPYILRVVVQERGPGLSSWSCGANMPHVLLNGAFADVDAQFE